MSGHTPGPWRLHTSEKSWQNPFQIERDDGACLFSFGDSLSHADAEADARLIAAAPELLDALLDAECELACRHRINSHVIDKVRTAIAKATGAQS